MNREILLEIKNLKTHFFTDEGVVKAVNGVSLKVQKTHNLGIIGESGSGKTVTAFSILNIINKPGKIVSGDILLNREGDIVNLLSYERNSVALRSIRGKDIAMIFQEPMSSLSPVHSIGFQLTEAMLLHLTRDKNEAVDRAHVLLEKVGISGVRQRMKEYPHQLSGGMRQRVMIAMALSCNPQLLIADEPTTALDVTVQAQILELIKTLQVDNNMSLMYITHNLGVIAEVADMVAVMYLGKVVEYGTKQDIFKKPAHPYTRCLLNSIPKLKQRAAKLLDVIQGTVPTPIDLPNECVFMNRCPSAMTDKCSRAHPGITVLDESHYVSCYLYSDIAETDDA